MNAVLKPFPLETDILKIFRGRILTPNETKNLKGFESLFSDREKEEIQAKTDHAKKIIPSQRGGGCKSPIGRSEQYEENQMSLQDVGFFKKKEEKENGIVFDLEIKIPFHQKQNFYVFKPKTKKEESQPDFLIFDNGCRVGSIWNPKEGKKAYSGEIFSLGVNSYIHKKTNEDHPFMRFLIIEKENQKGEKHHFVSIQYGAENWDGVTQEEQPDPFG
jgi:hypothetical protein